MTDLGCLKHFLSFEIDRTGNDLLVTESKYAHDLLLRFGLANTKPYLIPGALKAPSSNTRLVFCLLLMPNCIDRWLVLFSTILSFDLTYVLQ